jgi:hypothetical protein
VQALSGVAALAMLRWPAPQTTSEDILVRLQATITNNVAIERAKGVLAECGGTSIQDVPDHREVVRPRAGRHGGQAAGGVRQALGAVERGAGGTRRCRLRTGPSRWSRREGRVIGYWAHAAIRSAIASGASMCRK